MTDLFGDLGSLAEALGVTEGDWFAAPDRHLKTILSDPDQRAALVDLVDDLFGGEEATSEDGRTLVPIARRDPVRLFATLTEHDEAAEVGVLLRVEEAATSTAMGGRLELAVPLVTTAEAGGTILLGTSRGAIALDVSLAMPTAGAAGPGGIDLRAAGLGLRIPTDGSPPDVTMTLQGLMMPGASAPTDLVVDPGSVGALGGSLVQFVFGLIRAQLADAAAGDSVRAMAGLFGLVGGDDVPDFPVGDLLAQGPGALARWWALALAPDVRDAWYDHLATALGGELKTVDGPVVDVDIAASVRLRLSVRTAPGAAGLPSVTPVIAVMADAADGVELALEVEPVTLDLATGAAVPLPSLRTTGRIEPTPGPLVDQSVPVDGEDWQLVVEAIEAGFALTADRTPRFVLAASGVRIGLTDYARLDLTDADALAAIGADTISDAAGAVLANLGALGDGLSQILGVGGPVPIDPTLLLSDPIRAVADRWRRVFAEQAAAVRGQLEPVRAALSAGAGAITGEGSVAAPYRIPLADGLAIEISVGDLAGDVCVGAALVASTAADLPAPDARARVDARVGLLRATLAVERPSASVFTELSGGIAVEHRTGGMLQLGDDGGVALRIRGLGARVRWRPGAAPDLAPWLAEPALTVAGALVDLGALRDAGVVDGGVTPLTDAASDALDAAAALAVRDAAAGAWPPDAADALAAAVEQLAAGVLAGAQSDARAAVRELLAWGQAGAGATGLSLAAMVDDPADEARRWSAAVCGVDLAAREVTDSAALVAAVSRISRLTGLDVPDVSALAHDPLRFALPGLEVLAGFAGDEAARVVSRVTALEHWSPGDPLPAPEDLLAGLAADSSVDPVLFDLLAGRTLSPASIEGLVARLAGTDGVVGVAGASLPDGLMVSRIDGLIHTAALDDAAVADAVTAALGAVPDHLVLVVVEAVGEPDLRPRETDPTLEVDLTAAGAPAESFALPGPAPVGLTLVRLPGKAAAIETGASAAADAGFDAQVARLSRILASLASDGIAPVVVAGGAAGRVAVEAAAVTDVSAVFTVGTPWSPVALGDVDSGPAAEALRLFASLADLGADGADALADRGRQLIHALLGRDGRGDPLTELAAPARDLPARLDVRALVGTVAEDAVRAALTALVAQVLSVRAALRATLADAAQDVSRAGVRIPLAWGATPGGLRAELETDLDLAALAATAAAGAAPPRRLTCRLRLRADGRWLIGGPDPGRGPGLRPLALRGLTIEAQLPLGSGDADPETPSPAGTGRVVLHDALVFGVRRARWEIDLTSAGALLPELRALLGELAATLQRSAPTDPAAASVRDLLRSLGVIGPDDGFDAVTLTTLLADPAAVLRAAVTEAASRSALATALRAAAGDTRADASSTVRITHGAAASGRSGEVTFDLDSLTLAATAQIEPMTDAAVPSIVAHVSGSPGRARLDLTLAWAAGFGLQLSLGAADGDVQVTAGLAIDAYGGPVVPLWPPDAASASAERIGAVAVRFAQDAALGLGLDALRGTFATVDAARQRVDAVLDAVGLLAPAAAGAPRALRWPGDLLADPGAWLADRAGGLASAVPALLAAASSALDRGSDAGTLRLVAGLDLTAAPAADGAVRIGMRLGPQALPGADFALEVDAAALVRPGSRPLPTAAVSIATDEGALEIAVGQDAGGADDAVGVTVALRPAGSAVIPLYPGGAGFGVAARSAAGAAVKAALPWLLEQVAALDVPGDPGTAPEIAGRVVARAGRALGIAQADPAGALAFDPADFRAFVDAPAAALQAALGSAASDALADLAGAVEALFDPAADVTVDVTGGVLAATIGLASRVSVTWDSAGAALGVAVASDAIPLLGSVRGAATVSSAGVREVRVAIGRTTLDVGTVTLRPLARFAWTPVHASVELGLAAGDETRVLVRLTRIPPAAWSFAVAAETGEVDDGTLLAAAGAVREDAAEVAAALARTMLGLAADVVLSFDAVQTFLDASLPGDFTPREVLEGTVLNATGGFDLGIIEDLGDAEKLLDRLARLAQAIAPELPTVPVGGLGIGIHIDGDVIGLRLDVDGEAVLADGDIRVSLVADAAWINEELPAGVRIGILSVAGGAAQPDLAVDVNGLGIRFARSSGPLLDAGLRIEALRLLTYAHISGEERGGGVSVSLDGLGLELSGGGDGGNPIAEGVMPSAGADEDAPRPAFSPALNILKEHGSALEVSVTVGTSPGPWWLTVQRQLGPVYLEQVGLAVETSDGSITKIQVLIDGGVSLFGFAATVDDLSLTYHSPGSAFAPTSWSVDVAGFAISAETAGLTLAGGLRKFTPGDGGVEYLGMLLARFGTYGLTVYGGFAQVGPPEDEYLSLFLVGGVNGPIGGVPAFFVTGIAGGFGVNRRLIVPTDLADLSSFPLMRALNSAAEDVDPFKEVESLRGSFPAERGSFWFAAGLSFNSFVLVDGMVAVAIEFGNGFELSILGLARLSLPRPQLTLVQIELALVARVSSREGLLLVQAQLTDNSWLLSPSVRLTGGFAFAAWFAGPRKGEFVLTMGGYHPDFQREGYPVVPRLGIDWRIGDAIVVAGTSYFALTSEALMAGVRIEIHAELGPAWAHLVLGADAIVYFDPFWLQAKVYASIDAGITIDVWIGTITISVHLGASITLEGPPFHAICKIEIGPASVTLEIGPSESAPDPLDWQTFLAKYLEDAGGGRARALAAITGKGTVPPSGGPQKGGAPSPDGQPDRPFAVVAEFRATLTSTVPLATFEGMPLRTITGDDGTSPVDLPGVPLMAIAPMHKPAIRPALTLHIRERGTDGTGTGPNLEDRRGIVAAHATGDFPLGVWGPLPTEKTVPSGDLLRAPNTIAVEVSADIPDEHPAPAIPYHQVRTGVRRILPLLPSVHEATLIALRDAAGTTVQVVDALRAALPVAADTDLATIRLSGRAVGGLGRVRGSDWRAGLAAPVRLGSLGQDIGELVPAPEVTRAVVPPAVVPRPARPARLAALLAAPAPAPAPSAIPRGARAAAGGTAVSPALLERVLGGRRAPTATAPSIAAAAAALDPVLPTRLLRTQAAPRLVGETVLTVPRPADAAPAGGGAAVLSRTGDPETLRTLRQAGAALTDDGIELTQGQVAVLELPDGARDTAVVRPRLVCETGWARVVVLGGGGTVLADVDLAADGAAAVPVDARGLAVVAAPAAAPDAGFALHGGWHDTSLLPSATAGALVGHGCVVNAVGVFAERDADAPVAWSTPSAVAADRAPTCTTFSPAGAGRAVQAIAVGVTGSGSDGVAIGLENGEPLGDPLVTTDADGASVVVVAVRASDEGPLVVNAAIEEGRDVTGVVAAADSADAEPAATADLLVKAIAARGLEDLDLPVSTAGPALTRIRWSQP